MVRFFALYRRNPVAPWPTDPVEFSKFMEKAWAGIDDLIKKGEIVEFGYFENGTSGYIISEVDPTVGFKNVSMFVPYWEFEVHVITPYEKGKEILRALLKARAEAAK
ncbi:MAG: hypothetical protein WAN82_02795 [Candidatus Bathyarchaeia archaeon]